MALNLMTPRYVAPDVTKAPLAGEAIRSSQASTNLAAQAQATRDRAQQAQEQQFRAQLGLSAKEQAEASAARRGNLALGWERADQGWEELSLRAEAQSVNLANTEQQMRHREDRLPFEIDALALANEAQNLKNELDDATMDDRMAKVRAELEGQRNTNASKRASTQAIINQTSYSKRNHELKEAQLTRYQDLLSMLGEGAATNDWDFVDKLIIDGVNPAQAMHLESVKTDMRKQQASINELMTRDRQSVNAINQSTANQAVIGKLPTVAMQGFWRQANVTNFSGNTQYTDGNGMLTPEGQAALSAQAEWLGLNLTQSDTDQLMTMPVGSSQGQGWLLSGNPAGEKFLNGSMFIPTEEALQEAKALKAKQRATFQANIIPTEFEYEKHGVKVKGQSIGEMSKEAQQAHMDSVADTYKALLATDEYTGVEGHRKAWANAVMQSKTDMGKIAFIAPSDFAAFNKVKGGEMYFDAQSLGYKIKPHTKVGTGGPPTPTATAAADFDPLPKDYDGPKSDVYNKRKTINVELTGNGMPQDVASWAIEIGSRTRWLKDDWDTSDDLVGLVAQAERRAGKMIHLEHIAVATAALGLSQGSLWGPSSKKDFPHAAIVEVGKHLDKPFSQWPLPNGDVEPYTIESAALLKKHIPEYLKLKRYEDELNLHMKLPVYKGQSREY